ncbi:MAG: Glu/Leu/Phe/Val family dehydrogenase [bacterium]
MELSFKDENNGRIFTATHHGDVLGYVAIDSTIRGRSCGGLRMLPDIDEAEIRMLARSMTLKYGFLGLPQGGAKAGVLGNPEAPESERLERLVEFGHAIGPLLRTNAFIPASDMGTQDSDILYMLHSVGMHVTRRDFRTTSSGYYTGLSVMAGVIQSAQHLGLDLSRCTAAIEGFGNVGKPLADLLRKAGVKIVAISTSRGGLYNPQGLDVDRLVRLAEQTGSRVVEHYHDAELIVPEKLLELPVDILCPCARWNSLNMTNVERIVVKVICPGANNPITPEAENVLFERGVLCLPDFVTNCGGVLGGTMEFASISREKITTFINHHLGIRIAWLLNEAMSKHQLPREVVVPFALRRFSRVAQRAERTTPFSRLFRLGLEYYRRGWIPGPFIAPLSLRYFKKILT